MKNKRRAFTLVELLISLALMAALLAALAAGVHAALTSYEANDKIASTTQTARYIMARLTSEIRTAKDVDVPTANLIVIEPPQPNAKNIKQIKYELTNGSLWFRQTIGTTEMSSQLLSSTGDVTIAGFAATREWDLADPNITMSVTVDMTLKAGDNTFEMKASASPRRNQKY